VEVALADGRKQRLLTGDTKIDPRTLTIDGDPKMRTHFLVMAGNPSASMREHVTASNVATAMQILNAVPAVCAAPPGFATMADLPLIRSVTGFGNST
jgi:hypothetical protein